MPTEFRVIVLPTAFADLDRITAYIERESPQNAAEVLDRLWQATQSLATFPHRYKVHQLRPDAAKTVRSMPVPPFILYYRIDDAKHVVRVL